MKVTIDSRAAMKNAANVAREYREEFIRCLEMEFNMRIVKNSTEQLEKHGIDIIRKEDS
ncbi:hypothetical protein Q7178_000785 [Enterococcus faecium]|nr:hypothetical protein [Enterococcus faecium]